MKYFTECRTAEELKKAYRQIVKKLHPDVGGSEEEFKTMQAEFSASWDRLKNIHHNGDGKTYSKETEETATEFMDIIEELLKLNGVEIEICGSWIWCSGNTKANKETLKRLRFRWSQMKSAWYYHKEPYRKHHGKELSLDEIRSMYGSTKYEREEVPALQG